MNFTQEPSALSRISAIQEGKYIRHAPCMRQVHPKYNRCSETYHEKTAKLNKVNSAVVQFSETERRRNTKCSRYEPGSYICLTAANLSPTLCPPSVVVTFILVGLSFSTNLLRIY
ncbi:hypothetical protein Avbf_04019, partial [Armadillidium vulgare]